MSLSPDFTVLTRDVRVFWCFNDAIFLNFISTFYICGTNAILMKIFFEGYIAIFEPNGSK